MTHPQTTTTARGRFRTWRRSRPFWGGLLTILAGLELFGSGQLDLGHIHLQFGVQGMQATIIPLVLVLLGVLVWAMPVHRVFYGVIALVLSVYSLIGVNLGGFVIGMILGIVGAVVTVSWLPRDRPSDAGHAGLAGHADDATEVLPRATGSGAATDDSPHGDVGSLFPALDDAAAPRPFSVAPAEPGAAPVPGSSSPLGPRAGRRASHRVSALGVGILASVLGAGLASSGAVPAQAATSGASTGVLCDLLAIACAPAAPSDASTPAPTPTPTPTDGASGDVAPGATTGSDDPSSDEAGAGSDDAPATASGGTHDADQQGAPVDAASQAASDGDGDGTSSGHAGTSGGAASAGGAGEDGAGTAVGTGAGGSGSTGAAGTSGTAGADTSGTSDAQSAAKNAAPDAATAETPDETPSAADDAINALLTAVPAPHLPQTADQPVAPRLAAHLSGTALQLTNSHFVGNATLRRPDGSTVTAMKFVADKVVVPGFTLDVPNGDGHGLIGESSQMTESGHVVLYATKLTGSLLGVKVTFTPGATPPPLIPLPSLDDPRIELVANLADSNTQEGSHQYLY